MADENQGSGQAPAAGAAQGGAAQGGVAQGGGPQGNNNGQQSAQASAAGGQGGGAAAAPVAFAEQLPESIRGEAVFRDIKDLEGLAKSYFHAQKMLGRDPKSLLPIPSADDADGLNAVYTALGRPESPDKYQLTAAKLPEGVSLDEKLQSGFLTKAHELGLNNRQTDALYAWWNEYAGNAYTQTTESKTAKLNETAQALRQEWGQAFDQNLALGEAALNHFAETLKLGTDLSAQLKETGLNNSPAIIKMLAHLGGQLKEDGLLGKEGAGSYGQGQKSPGEAQQEISALQQDAAFMKSYGNKNAPGHDDAVKKMQTLYQFAYPVR